MKTTTPTQHENGSGRWEVRIDPTTRRRAFAGVQGAHIGGPPHWNVKSPRGVQVFTTPDPVVAMDLAHAMASIDELLARVYRLERNVFGQHPALRASVAAARPHVHKLRDTLRVIQDPHA
ncbi:Uncharacterised protein [Mycobacteroides abscessus subsp. abscessus]|uniref:hypothetical protein n=1 Tax=Mycobacteroides abscessus TaxID=36809 RepID=UPI00092C5200|nr:hypothetical protein [Mycobacteroides abscessus]MDO3312373.1 hypothetical protein [Mycobacteroides abscessus subsp. abscessus]MDO3344945.1 hypothetical protein [Mycobacteroides abscessus subsp. abscessus]SHP09971.1 Uncharacterised protein [Mycobacteroides abscessus subsp. abscessus]SHP23926.1 Uncharacterised protein [Mycobacteroides abscessus subsp. abscessus]SHP94839.1 Uncharacterised protein [Mycobacteroides abscessus subsp. abscessus]